MVCGLKVPSAGGMKRKRKKEKKMKINIKYVFVFVLQGSASNIISDNRRVAFTKCKKRNARTRHAKIAKNVSKFVGSFVDTRARQTRAFWSFLDADGQLRGALTNEFEMSSEFNSFQFVCFFHSISISCVINLSNGFSHSTIFRSQIAHQNGKICWRIDCGALYAH